jgi:hypothetical protein
MRVAFVSCVKTKAQQSDLAEHLYISPWFRMAAEYARRNSDRWFILSALHGMIEPRHFIAPYDATLNGAKVDERFDWSLNVIDQMGAWDLKGELAVVLAGENYRRFLMDELHRRFRKVVVPMKGLMMGQQLSWMKGMMT